MKDLGAINLIFGMKIKIDQVGRRLCLSQSKYVEIISKHFNMQESKSVKAPILLGVKLFDRFCCKTHEEMSTWNMSLMLVL